MAQLLLNETTEADQLAERCRAANHAALAGRQAQLARELTPVGADVNWVFARDGYLTALNSGNRWHTGCSVPLLAARMMLKSLDPGDGAVCFLDPKHAAQVRVVLDRLQPSQALICVITESTTLAVMLNCDDFSADVAHGRLFFISGERWAEELGKLFDDVPGLPTPSRFVRLPSSDTALIERLVSAAQDVFTAHNARRSSAVAELRKTEKQSATGDTADICVIARSTFRLWDDAGDALFTALECAAMTNARWRRFDPDDPAGSSSLALATAAHASNAIVAADLFRCDAPNVTSPQLPWITWVTAPRIAPVQADAPNDRLILADPAWNGLAMQRGWPADRITSAGWPVACADADDANGSSGLAIIADTMPLDPPESLSEFSSHCLLWETVRRFVLRDPFALPGDVAGWLRDRANANGIDNGTLDTTLFVNRLIVPAYQQALAGALLDAGLPLLLYGAGWFELPRFRAHAHGPVAARQELRDIARGAAALVHAWPGEAGVHPIDAVGRPVVRRTGRRMETFIRVARSALNGAAEPRRAAAPPISSQVILSMLGASR